ncbi:hypothetical protein CDAR_240761 [Caerostris darwini]|uniref:Uncharacterized protein n=1 Tax=Caerostris darwini TaxID=1538125 RepID=A0AAV4UAG3_9ARAC|nr:hypothetical protein CDAR_240761 [Caerostris darwini]
MIEGEGSSFCCDGAPVGQQNELKLQEAALKNDVEQTKKVLESKVDLNAKGHPVVPRARKLAKMPSGRILATFHEISITFVCEEPCSETDCAS